MIIGNLKEKNGKEGDTIFVGSICLTDLDRMETLNKSVVKGKNGNEYLKIIIVPNEDEDDKFGNTHVIKTALAHYDKD